MLINKITHMNERSGDKRDIITIGGMCFYRSTGHNSGAPGTWFPFWGLNESNDFGMGIGWFKKPIGHHHINRDIENILNEPFKDYTGTPVDGWLGRIHSVPALLISSLLGGGLWDHETGFKTLKEYLKAKYPEFYRAWPTVTVAKEGEVFVDKFEDINNWLVQQLQLQDKRDLFHTLITDIEDLKTPRGDQLFSSNNAQIQQAPQSQVITLQEVETKTLNQLPDGFKFFVLEHTRQAFEDENLALYIIANYWKENSKHAKTVMVEDYNNLLSISTVQRLPQSNVQPLSQAITLQEVETKTLNQLPDGFKEFIIKQTREAFGENTLAFDVIADYWRENSKNAKSEMLKDYNKTLPVPTSVINNANIQQAVQARALPQVPQIQQPNILPQMQLQRQRALPQAPQKIAYNGLPVEFRQDLSAKTQSERHELGHICSEEYWNCLDGNEQQRRITAFDQSSQRMGIKI